MKYRTILFLIFGMWGCLNISVYAHDIPISTIHIIPDQNEVHLQLTMNSFELTFLSEVDQDHNGYMDGNELDAKRALIKKRLLSTLTIMMDGTTIHAGSAGIQLNELNHHLVLKVHYPKEREYESLKLISDIEGITSKSQITQVTYGKSGHHQKALLQAGSNTATFVSVGNRKAGGFWATVSPQQPILSLGLIGLILFGGMYFARKHLLTKSKT